MNQAPRSGLPITGQTAWQAIKKKTLEAAILTAVVLLLLAAYLAIYYGMFYLLETYSNEDKAYSFVSTLRIGLGFFMLGLSVLASKSRANRIIKLGLYTCSYSVVFIGLGVQLHRQPWLFCLLVGLAYGVTILFLRSRKMGFLYFYAALLSLAPVIVYL